MKKNLLDKEPYLLSLVILTGIEAILSQNHAMLNKLNYGLDLSPKA